VERVLYQEGIADNLRFMVLEVIKQVENAQRVLNDPDQKLIEAIGGRDDYIDNLKSVIENKCYSLIHRQGVHNKRRVDLLRATNTVSSNLERIADFAVNIVSQLEYLKTPGFIKRYDFEKFFKEVLAALEVVYQAMSHLDMNLAFKICRAEQTLDLLYKMQFDRIMVELRSGRETENLITSHLILRYLERMGDSLLNIGEAIIFAAVGEKFKIRQYEALKEILTVSGFDAPISDVEFQSIWGTRSGCRISKVAGPKGQEDGKKTQRHGVLFKEGNRRKLLQEKKNIERWEALMPGLPPRVLAHQEEEGQASLLIEFLGGCTFQDVILNAEPEIVKNAFFLVEQTLFTVWDSTLARGPVYPEFLSQLTSRLDDVYRLHPGLENQAKVICGKSVPTLRELVERCAAVEERLAAPYSVFIHGDFNINNIVYDHETQKVHFIDLHRSRQADMLQDVSVFLASNFRLPVFEKQLRSRLNWCTRRMYRFARRYARENGDPGFDARLALGLARSFVTSARFELNPRFAKKMYLRGAYLLEGLLAHQGRPWEEYLLRESVLVY
jgi:phosphate uptake regulator/aminoglycoside phosphotransferase